MFKLVRFNQCVENNRSHKKLSNTQMLTQRNYIMNLIIRSWTQEEIDMYNKTYNTDMTELDIKRNVLRDNCAIFTADEYTYYMNYLKPKTKSL